MVIWLRSYFHNWRCPQIKDHAWYSRKTHDLEVPPFWQTTKTPEIHVKNSLRNFTTSMCGYNPQQICFIYFYLKSRSYKALFVLVLLWLAAWPWFDWLPRDDGNDTEAVILCRSLGWAPPLQQWAHSFTEADSFGAWPMHLRQGCICPIIRKWSIVIIFWIGEPCGTSHFLNIHLCIYIYIYI